MPNGSRHRHDNGVHWRRDAHLLEPSEAWKALDEVAPLLVALCGRRPALP